jgi:predicted GH43/DUF377 family glycosyl hydrolase
MPVAGGYKMWYTAWDTTIEKANIGYATSTNEIDWQRDTLNNPVLTTGAPGQWDDQIVGWCQVILIDSTYYMWYEGDKSGVNLDQIGLATSPDGIQWTKYNDPVLKPSPGKWDGTLVWAPSVMLIDDTLHMWYCGSRFPTESFLWRIGKATSPDVTGLFNDEAVQTPDVVFLNQNYPNPFNPSTTIEFSLPKSEYVELRVYNILGKEVTTLVSNKLNHGNHTYTFDGQNLASGVYYYQLVAGDYREVKKMVLLR